MFRVPRHVPDRGDGAAVAARVDAAAGGSDVRRGGGGVGERESKGDVVPTAKADADEPECASGGGGEGIWGIQLLFYPSIIKIN